MKNSLILKSLTKGYKPEEIRLIFKKGGEHPLKDEICLGPSPSLILSKQKGASKRAGDILPSVCFSMVPFSTSVPLSRILKVQLNTFSHSLDIVYCILLTAYSVIWFCFTSSSAFSKGFTFIPLAFLETPDSTSNSAHLRTLLLRFQAPI